MTTLQVHAVPQHQGAVRLEAGRLPTGCSALSALAAQVLGVEPHVVPVASGTTPRTGGVANFGGLWANRSAQLAALRGVREPVLTVGGDCGVEAVPLAVLRQRVGPGLGVVWWDAHGDLNTPATSPSGAFHGMVLRAAFGEGDPAFTADPPLHPGRAVLAGVRALDEGERDVLATGLAVHLPPERVRGPAGAEVLADTVVGTGAETVYLHIDLDVLDPEEFGGVCCPEPDGLTVADVVAGIEAVATRLPVVGAGITECTTTDPHRLRRVVPLLEALAAALTAGVAVE
ncbi:MAG TPA: arginase family protein [Pseudonocardiaceae bacterium]